MKRLLIYALILVLFSCSKKENSSEEQYNFDVNMEFSLVNLQNEDLLDSSTENHYNESDIKLYYLINGEVEEVFNEQYHNPRNFMIYKHENEYRIRVTLNNSETSQKPLTYIQWRENELDTIEVEYLRTSKAVIKEKIWLNNQLIWERGNDTDAYYVLEK